MRKQTYAMFAIIVLLILVGVVSAIYRQHLFTVAPLVQKPEVNSFTECVAAGYPMTESYPQTCRDHNGTLFVQDLEIETASSTLLSEESYKDLIKVSNLRPDDIISNHFNLMGEARGSWFFEGSFLIRVTDEKGNTLGETHANPQSEWTTADYVPFTAELSFTLPAGVSRGSVIMIRDNASGLPERDDSWSIPVQFSR